MGGKTSMIPYIWRYLPVNRDMRVKFDKSIDHVNLTSILPLPRLWGNETTT
jgi:hypothetical protein